MKIVQVLNGYRREDADKRMSWCLYYREFRDEFIGIEQDDPMDLETSRQESSPRRPLLAILHVLQKHRRSLFFHHLHTDR